MSPSPGVVVSPSPGVVVSPSPDVVVSPWPGVVVSPWPGVVVSPSSVGGAEVPSGGGAELPSGCEGAPVLAGVGVAPGGGARAWPVGVGGAVRGEIGPTPECGVPTPGGGTGPLPGGVGVPPVGGGPPPDGGGGPPPGGGTGPEPGGDAGPPPDGGLPPGGESPPDAGHPRGCQRCGGRGPPPPDVSPDGVPNCGETTTGIRPCAKFAGFPGWDARTISLVAPSCPASTSSVLPTTSAVAVSGSRLVRRVNENPVAPSKYAFRSTRVVAPGAISIEGASPENRGAVGVESPFMMSAAPAHQIVECLPFHPVATTARCRLNLPASRINSCTASWSATARARCPLRSEPCRSVRMDQASLSPVQN